MKRSYNNLNLLCQCQHCISCTTCCNASIFLQIKFNLKE